MINLKTLPDATAQEVFDQAVNHLRKQGKQSVRPATPEEKEQFQRDTICVYRGSDGDKCAGGCFIADDEYDANMEGKTWNSHGMRKLTETGAHQDLIRRMQQVHDGWNPKQWEAAFIRVANDHNLIYKPV